MPYFSANCVAASLLLDNQVKAEKCGSNMWTEVHELAALLREGETKWEDLNLDDVDIRMKFAGLFHRGKRTPQRFMMRLKVRRGAWLGPGEGG
jgi:ferredoxin-nitrite reductase